MEQLQIAYLPRRGTEERWRRLWQDVAELCPEQFAAACQQAGITQLQVRLTQLLHSEVLLVSVQMQESQQTRKSLTSSQSQFAHWLGEQLQALLGWDVQELLDNPPVDLLFTWEVEGDDGCNADS
jgi:DNA-binding transcriptional regulator YiaG